MSKSKNVRVGGTMQQQAEDFGPLAQLFGTWKGSKGVNVVSVPDKTNGFALVTQKYHETITFTPIAGKVPNRRGDGSIAFLSAVKYDLTVWDDDSNTIHAENGMWLFQNPYNEEHFPIIRQACVPHGNMVIALGKSSVINGAPDFSTQAIRSFSKAAPEPLPAGADDGYDDVFSPPADPKIGVAANATSLILAKAIEGQNITKTTLLDVSTKNHGGGVLNIPYITRHADTPNFASKFWIEEVEEHGRTTLQLQYMQRTEINFLKDEHGKPVTWPHIDVNTLKKS